MEIRLERERVIMIILIALVIYFAFTAFFPKQKTLVANESIELCEADNPNYNPTEECSKYIFYKYRGLECNQRFDNAVFTAFGSCRDCIIECYK